MQTQTIGCVIADPACHSVRTRRATRGPDNHLPCDSILPETCIKRYAVAAAGIHTPSDSVMIGSTGDVRSRLPSDAPPLTDAAYTLRQDWRHSENRAAFSEFSDVFVGVFNVSLSSNMKQDLADRAAND